MTLRNSNKAFLPKMHNSGRVKGFTLLELSIVLVIIGLVVGGVLVGRDLIKGAEMRAFLSQIEQFKTATHTFQTKYNTLPGDMPPSTAAQLGFHQLTGTEYFGDNNGLINSFDSQGAIGSEMCNPVDALEMTGAEMGGETFTFWKHLSQSNLIGFVSTTLTALGSYNSPFLPATLMPKSKLGNSSYFYVCVYSQYPVFPYNLPGNYIHAVGLSNSKYVKDISAIEAYNIDQKTDDGKPNTGSTMISHADMDNGAGGGYYSVSWAASPTSGNCLAGGSGDVLNLAANYNTSVSGDEKTCYGVMFKM